MKRLPHLDDHVRDADFYEPPENTRKTPGPAWLNPGALFCVFVFLGMVVCTGLIIAALAL